MADSFVGQKIKDIRPMTPKEYAAEGWDEDRYSSAMVIELENGATLYPSRDSEGNGHGALFGMDTSGKTLGFFATRSK